VLRQRMLNLPGHRLRPQAWHAPLDRPQLGAGMKYVYLVVFSVPGHLLGSEPQDFHSLEEARSYVMNGIESISDSLEPDDLEPWRNALIAASTLPEEGGIIHLPDGSVADVSRESLPDDVH